MQQRVHDTPNCKRGASNPPRTVTSHNSSFPLLPNVKDPALFFPGATPGPFPGFPEILRVLRVSARIFLSSLRPSLPYVKTPSRSSIGWFGPVSRISSIQWLNPIRILSPVKLPTDTIGHEKNEMDTICKKAKDTIYPSKSMTCSKKTR